MLPFTSDSERGAISPKPVGVSQSQRSQSESRVTEHVSRVISLTFSAVTKIHINKPARGETLFYASRCENRVQVILM